MRTSHRLKKLALACALISTLSLASCETLKTVFGGQTEGVDVNAVACRAFKPITWSGRDTDDTIRQVREHNAAYLALCEPPPAH